MSGIFGIVHFDGAPLDPGELSQLRDAMAHWGPHGVRVTTTGDAAFGQCVLEDTPEAAFESLPRLSRDGDYLFTAEARLDNRDELCDALQVPLSERPRLADGELARRAYERWGEDCPNRLFGDWSLAAWHPAARRCFLARDHQGTTALHYWRDRDTLIFASDLRAVSALPRVPSRLNEVYLAQLLLVWTAFQGPDTPFADVHRLPPAHAIACAGSVPRIWRYWRPEEGAPLELPTQDQYAETLIETLERAVRGATRHCGGLGVTLSAGLDSGAVAALAARALRARGEGLTAFTFVPVHSPAGWITDAALHDEWPGAAEVAAASGIEDHVRLAVPDASPVAALREAPRRYGEPVMGAPNLYWLLALGDHARARGIRTVLLGQGGNGTISWRGDVLALPTWTLARLGYYRALPERLLPHRLGRALRRWHTRRTWGASPGEPTWRTYSALSPAAFRRLRMAERMRDAGYDPLLSAIRADQSESLLLGREVLGAFWAATGAGAGVVYRDPTMDARVIQLCLSIPNRWWVGPRDRWLIRQAVRGVLPDAVRLARRRGSQAADLVPRLVSRRGELEGALADLHDTAAEALVDVPYLHRVARELEGPPSQATTNRAVAILMRGLGVGLFLTNFNVQKRT